MLLFSFPNIKGQTILTSELVCSDDAQVNEAFPDTNYGATELMSVGSDTNLNVSYLAFDMSNKPKTYLKAEFAVNLWYTVAPDQDFNISLSEAENAFGEPWSETSITWNNMPLFFAVIESFKVDQNFPSKTYYINITSSINDFFRRDFFSVALECNGENGSCYCLTKEYSPANSSDAPRIILYYSNETHDLPSIPFVNVHILGISLALGIALTIIKTKKLIKT